MDYIIFATKRTTMEATVLNPAQQELLDMMAFVKSPESLKELKKVITIYFAKKARESVDEMWKTGELNNAKFESFKTLHERTPYKN